MKRFTTRKSKKEVFDAAKKACSKLDLKIRRSDFRKGKLLIKHEGSLLSFGNDLTVTISSKIDKVVISIVSESSASIQVVDWGVNEKLEVNLIAEIRDILHR